MATTNNGLEINVKINESEIERKIKAGAERAQIALDNQVLKDSNKYCPLDTSALQKSAIISTVIGSGRIVWSTPYAKKLYYDESINISRQKNPNASRKWFEVAKAKNLNNWVKLANDQYNKGN